MGQIHVEHMQLVVARGDLAVRADQIRAIGEAVGVELDGERADMQVDAKLAGERAKPLERRARLLGLRGLQRQLGLLLHQRGVLGRLHIGGAALRGAGDQPLGRLQIGLDRAARAELHQRGAKALVRRRGHVSSASARASGVSSQASSLPSRSSPASSS